MNEDEHFEYEDSDDPEIVADTYVDDADETPINWVTDADVTAEADRQDLIDRQNDGLDLGLHPEDIPGYLRGSQGYSVNHKPKRRHKDYVPGEKLEEGDVRIFGRTQGTFKATTTYPKAQSLWEEDFLKPLPLPPL